MAFRDVAVSSNSPGVLDVLPNLAELAVYVCKGYIFVFAHFISV